MSYIALVVVQGTLQRSSVFFLPEGACHLVTTKSWRESPRPVTLFQVEIIIVRNHHLLEPDNTWSSLKECRWFSNHGQKDVFTFSLLYLAVSGMCTRLNKIWKFVLENALWFCCVHLRDTKERGCCLVRFSWSPVSTDFIYTTKHMLH